MSVRAGRLRPREAQAPVPGRLTRTAIVGLVNATVLWCGFCRCCNGFGGVQAGVGGRCGILLGFLLGAAGTRAAGRAGKEDLGGEDLGVIWSLFAHPVLGYTETP